MYSKLANKVLVGGLFLSFIACSSEKSDKVTEQAKSKIDAKTNPSSIKDLDLTSVLNIDLRYSTKDSATALRMAGAKSSEACELESRTANINSSRKQLTDMIKAVSEDPKLELNKKYRVTFTDAASKDLGLEMGIYIDTKSQADTVIGYICAGKSGQKLKLMSELKSKEVKDRAVVTVVSKYDSSMFPDTVTTTSGSSERALKSEDLYQFTFTESLSYGESADGSKAIVSKSKFSLADYATSSLFTLQDDGKIQTVRLSENSSGSFQSGSTEGSEGISFEDDDQEAIPQVDEEEVEEDITTPLLEETSFSYDYLIAGKINDEYGHLLFVNDFNDSAMIYDAYFDAKGYTIEDPSSVAAFGKSGDLAILETDLPKKLDSSFATDTFSADAWDCEDGETVALDWSEEASEEIEEYEWACSEGEFAASTEYLESDTAKKELGEDLGDDVGEDSAIEADYFDPAKACDTEDFADLCFE